MLSTEDLHKKLNKIFPTTYEKLEMIGTLLGMGIRLTMFINKHKDFLKIPHDVHYAMANLIGNMMMVQEVLKSNPFEYEKISFSESDLPDEKKLAQVIKHLYETCKDQGLL